MALFLFATLPMTGHVTPGLPIARALTRGGHQVWWCTGRKFRSRIEATGARFVPMRAAYDYDDADLNAAFPGRDAHRGLSQIRFDLKRVFVDAAIGFVQDLEETLKRFPADVMIHDTGCLGVPLLSERVGVPHAAFGFGVLGMPSRDTAPSGFGMWPDASFFGRLRNRALNWSVTRVVFSAANAHYVETRRRLGLSTDENRNVFSDALSPYLHLQPTVPSFEYPRSDLPPQVHFIGPLPPEAASDFVPPSWWGDLGADRPVVHVTQGTVANDPGQLIVPTLKALAGKDVLVVATTGGRPVSDVRLDPLPENARVERFLPYAHLLPYVDVMVTSGGYGGVQAALARGIPLVAAGATEGKPEIGRRIEWARCGIDLRTASPDPARIHAAVRKILTGTRHHRSASRIRAEMAEYDAPARAVDLLERLAETGRPVVTARRPRRVASDDPPDRAAPDTLPLSQVRVASRAVGR